MLKCCFSLILWLLCLPLAAQKPFALVLGVTQDAGYPHIGCKRTCCQVASLDSVKQFVTSIAVADPDIKKWWLFEATPDITAQLNLFQQQTNGAFPYLPDGIFLTHAHIGHYTGLMYLGREALHTKNLSVYVLPKMKTFLETNGPWSQLVTLGNIVIKPLMADQLATLSRDVSVTAFTVPHRDEFSETAGFTIVTSAKRYLFIPDIDKWQKWSRNIQHEINQADIAFLDATFFSSDELPNRSIAEVPHPLVTETLQLITNKSDSQKIHFIHMNHTNPLLWNKVSRSAFLHDGYHVAVQGKRY